jgi:hypothetical protein
MEPIDKKISIFKTPKNFLQSAQKSWLVIRDPDSGVKKYRIPDSDLQHLKKDCVRRRMSVRGSWWKGKS